LFCWCCVSGEFLLNAKPCHFRVIVPGIAVSRPREN
jgi:hypothetical protein